MVGWRFTLAKKRLAKARVSSLRSQYQAVVRYRPWAVLSPRLWMSVMKASSAAGFIVRVMPNSLAALSELLKSVPALASPSTCAPEAWACSRNEEKSAAPRGTRTAPRFLPPRVSTTLEAAFCSCVPKA